MKLKPSTLVLYAVTDQQWLGEKSLAEEVEKVLKAGGTFIQLREKDLSFEDFVNLGKEIKKVTDRYQVPFVINDAVDVALACDADGVHVGQEDMEAGNVREKLGPHKILGVSVQTLEQALESQRKGADYLGVGAVFKTSTKLDAADVSRETLKEICENVEIPVVAIGGISSENVLELSGTGVDGIAVISKIFGASDITKATKNLRELSNQMVSSNMKKILTIAGSDSSGGAGIQADLKTIMAHKMYGMSAITALTAQNTTGVYDVLEATPAFVAKQLDCIFEDIFPDAVKIGMVSNPEIIEVIAKKLKQYQPKNIVIDPVMISTSGSKLLSDNAMETLIKKLLPLGDIVTPNIPEAESLCGFEIDTKEKMIEAGKVISKMITGDVLIKGGHFKGNADDLLYSQGKVLWFKSERINNPNNHGTGCTLSSAIACHLAKGNSMEESVRKGKAYVTGALEAGLDLGTGSGPLNHCYQY